MLIHLQRCTTQLTLNIALFRGSGVHPNSGFSVVISFAMINCMLQLPMNVFNAFVRNPIKLLFVCIYKEVHVVCSCNACTPNLLFYPAFSVYSSMPTISRLFMNPQVNISVSGVSTSTIIQRMIVFL